MASIYFNALFTIVAASGSNADAGLPGIRLGSRKIPQRVLTHNDSHFLTVIDGEYYGGVKKSNWIIRAWTFQEKIFSPRILYFTKEQVYWRCQEGTFLEEMCLEDVIGPRLFTVPGSTDTPETGIPTHSVTHQEYLKIYEDMLAAYRQCQITFQSDMINAFTGTTRALSALRNDRFIWGLPESSFSWALTWFMRGAHQRNKARVSVASKTKSITSIAIPSWSWAAWCGESYQPWVNFEVTELGKRQFFAPALRFYRCDVEGRLTLIDEDRELEVSEAGIQNPLREHLCLWKGVERTIDGVNAIPSGEEFLDSGRLRFWTSVAKLHVRRSCLDRQDGGHYHIVACKENGEKFRWDILPCMGSTKHIRGCSLEELPQSVAADVPKPWETDSDIFIANFLIVCRISSTIPGTKLITFKMLAVEWEHDIAYRIGCGVVDEDVWLTLKNREWKLVTLG